VKVRHALVGLGIAGGALGLSAAPAFAIFGASQAPPAPQVVGTGGATPSVVPQAAAPTTAPSTLPLTGGDVAGLCVIGVALIGGGTTLVRRTRARASD
jgi:hypothetical protein